MIGGPELVLVVPREALMGDPGWHGMRTDDLDGFEALVSRLGRFAERASAEADRTLKQVIPYLVLRDGERYFLMRRTRAGADARLHEHDTIGIGGHLNPGDAGLAGGLRREWTEEIEAAFVPEFRLIGLLNDDTSEVGSVHLGAIYLAEAGGRPVEIRETDKLSGTFATRDAVAAVVDRMETWSRLVFEHLEAVAAASSGPASLAGSGGMARGS